MVVYVSTVRPEVLDKAVVRPGRFDRKIYMEAPDAEGREQLFKKRLGKYIDVNDSDRLSKLLAKLTPGFVGADIVSTTTTTTTTTRRKGMSCGCHEDREFGGGSVVVVVVAVVVVVVVVYGMS